LSPIINEFLSYPKESDAENEWIELYNPNNQAIDISGWAIRDTQGKTHTFSVPSKTYMESNGFIVFRRPQTSIVLNNDGEGIAFKNANGAEIDTVAYEGKAKRGYSYARKEDGKWSWTSKVTVGSKNMFLGHSVSGAEHIADELLKDTSSVPRLSASLANVRQETNIQNQKSLFTVLVAGAIALFSSAGMLMLKVLLRK
jgi:hypothetical protein